MGPRRCQRRCGAWAGGRAGGGRPRAVPQGLGHRPPQPPPLARVTLAATQPDPAWTRRVASGPDGRQRHLSAVWDLAFEAPGVGPTSASTSRAPL